MQLANDQGDHMNRFLRFFSVILCAVAMLTAGIAANAASMPALDKDVMAALQSLYAKTPAARALGDKAQGILVFPRITKAGLIVGGQGGDGALVQKGKIVGYYNTGAVSVGLQAGVQQYGYTLFLMSDSALQYLKSSSGWELGVGPSIVIVDAGAAKNLSTTTAHSDIYAFIFDQKGLMAGAGLQGAKITPLDK
jgi:lipid-binding SYLF domain-containing protein